jgi:hypothetical protein
VSSTPPTGSKITIGYERGREVLRIPYAPRGAMVRFAAGFGIFWLVGWIFGIVGAGMKLMEAQDAEDKEFLLFWLAIWVPAGLFLLFRVYYMLRSSVPESFALRGDGITYDSGMPPYQVSSGFRIWKDTRKSPYRKHLVKEFSVSDLGTLKLRETDTGNRLTIDQDNQRLDLAVDASEIDREWLYGYLSQRYSLELVRGRPAGRRI